MLSLAQIKILFIIAGIYDGALGITFVFFPLDVFLFYGVEPPNHIGYVQFSAMLLIVFAVLFFRVAAQPKKNRELILYGCGLKISFCTITFFHEFTQGIPSMWLPWAWTDLAFLALFIIAWYSVKTA